MHTDDRSRRADEAALARLLDAQIAAWAAGDGAAFAATFTPDADVCRPEGKSVQTRVAVRQAGEWLFTSFQSTGIVRVES